MRKDFMYLVFGWLFIALAFVKAFVQKQSIDSFL